MGYNYTADFTIQISEATAIALALDLPRLNEQSSHNSMDTLPEFSSTNLMAEIFEHLDFEITSEEQDTVWLTADVPLSVISYQGYVNTKLRPSLDTIMVWLASCGVGINMNCRGEDDEMWQFSSRVHSGSLASRTLTTVTEQELSKLRSAEKTVQAILASVEANQFVDPYVVISALDRYCAAAAKA
jgi:hypothetical protein